MTFRDYLRVFWRRLPWFVLTFGVIFSAALFLHMRNQKVLYTGEVRVLLEPPPPVQVQYPGIQRFYSTWPFTLNTWQTLIISQPVRDKAVQELNGKGFNLTLQDFAGLEVSPEPNTNLAWIRFTHENRQAAVEGARAIARNAVSYSKDFTNQEITKAVNSAEKDLEDLRNKVTEEAEKVKALEANARFSHDIHNIEDEFANLPQELRSLDTHIRKLESEARAAAKKLEHVSLERAKVGHLQGQIFPYGTEAEILFSQHPRIKALEEQVTSLRVRLLRESKLKTPSHPDMEKLRDEINEAQNELSSLKLAVHGRELDREQVSLIREIESIQAEQRALNEYRIELRNRVDLVSKLHTELSTAKAKLDAVRGQEQRLNDIVNTLKASVRGSYVKLVEQPEEPRRMDTAGLARVVPLFLLISLIVAIGVVYFFEIIDTRLRTDQDVKKHLNYPVLGSVQRAEPTLALRGGPGALTECYDAIATLIKSSPGEQPVKVMLITSTFKGEGKTTATANLGCAFARQGHRTLVIDGDCRWPSLHEILNLPNETGFSPLLEGRVTQAQDAIQATSIDNLYALTQGPRPDNPYVLLQQERLKRVFSDLRAQFDYIVIDSPPLRYASDGLKLAGVADGVVFVVESGGVDQVNASWAKHLLENVHANVLGVILNKARIEHDLYYYYYYYYGKR